MSCSFTSSSLATSLGSTLRLLEVSGLVSGSVATLITDLLSAFEHFAHKPFFKCLASRYRLHMEQVPILLVLLVAGFYYGSIWPSISNVNI